MLARLYRLTSAKDFKRVYSAGRSANGKYVRVKTSENALAHSRFGVVVANSVSKHATKRNAIKRMIREIVRLQLTRLKPGMDVVISANGLALGANRQSIETELNWLLDKLKLRS